MNETTALQQALQLAGSQAELARKCGAKTRQAHVWKWLRSGRVSGLGALLVAKAVGYEVLPHQLRPDLYPNPWDGLPPAVAMKKFRGVILPVAA